MPRLFAATSLFALSLAAPTFAQESPPQDAEAEAPEQEEAIVVTARRRAESAQDVPIALSVVDAATIEATGTFNVQKLTQIQPALQLYTTNPRNTAVNIRGLGSPFGLTNDGIEQGVGIYIDQVYYSRVASSTFDFLDVAQLEILRGPQGTLYGKNTTAGAINITTRAPTFEFEGRSEITVGNLGFVQAKGSVSGPLVADKVAARFAASRSTRNGTIFNVTTGNRVNEQDNLGLRASILWKASDTLDLTLGGDYNRQNPECCAQIYVRVGATQRPLNRQYAALAAAFNYAPPSTNAFDRLTDLDADLMAKQELGGLSLRAEWELGEGRLTSVSAWRFWNWSPSNDRDFTGLPITTKSQNPSLQDQYTQELRYDRDGERVDFLIGAFGFHQKLRTAGLQAQGPAASRWLLNPASAAANNPATLNGLTSVNDIDFTNTSLALFGQIDWKITDRLSFQPGVRLNYDKKNGSYIATVTNGTGTALTADQRGILAPQSYTAKFSDWNLSYDARLSYEIARDIRAFATYARSFKSGGINLSGLPLDAANVPIQGAATVQPEKVDHFELGLKSQFWDRRITFNLAAYWTNIADYQAIVRNSQLAVLRGYLANADKVRVHGLEADFSIRPSERFNAYLNAAYTDGEYVKFTDAPCPPELSGGPVAAPGQTPSAPGTPGGISPANCNISGQWLPGISKWAVSYGAEYNVPATVFGREGQAYAGFEGNARTKFSSNPSRSIYTDIGGYALHNVRAGFRTEGFDLFVWAKNLFDVNYYEVLATTPGDTGLSSGNVGDERTYGVTLKAVF